MVIHLGEKIVKRRPWYMVMLKTLRRMASVVFLSGWQSFLLVSWEIFVRVLDSTSHVVRRQASRFPGTLLIQYDGIHQCLLSRKTRVSRSLMKTTKVLIRLHICAAWSEPPWVARYKTIFFCKTVLRHR